MGGHGFALVDFLVAPQIGHDRKVTSAAFHIARKRFLARVAVHVRLERARPGKSLVADLALVLLLRVR